MKQFKNIFLNLSADARVNFNRIAETRRSKMIKDGLEVNHINWEHYARVLEAKHEALKAC